MPPEDRFDASLANGGGWVKIPDADCARGVNAWVFKYRGADWSSITWSAGEFSTGKLSCWEDDEDKAVEYAKFLCQKNKWAGFSVARQWGAIYFKLAKHSLNGDWKYPSPENPEKSIDTYMWLTEKDAAIWNERKAEVEA